MSNQSPRFEVLLRSEQSNDQIAMIRIAVPPGWAGPPLHHHDFDEAFYVLDGELTFQLGAQRSTAGPVYRVLGTGVRSGVRGHGGERAC